MHVLLLLLMQLLMDVLELDANMDGSLPQLDVSFETALAKVRMGQNRLTHGLIFIFISQAEVDGFLVDMVKVKMAFPRLFQPLKSSSTFPRFRPKLSIHRKHLTGDGGDFVAFFGMHQTMACNDDLQVHATFELQGIGDDDLTYHIMGGRGLRIKLWHV